MQFYQTANAKENEKIVAKLPRRNDPMPIQKKRKELKTVAHILYLSLIPMSTNKMSYSPLQSAQLNC